MTLNKMCGVGGCYIKCNKLYTGNQVSRFSSHSCKLKYRKENEWAWKYFVTNAVGDFEERWG